MDPTPSVVTNMVHEPDSNRFPALADTETVPAGTQELEEVRDIRERSSHDRVPETLSTLLKRIWGGEIVMSQVPVEGRQSVVRVHTWDIQSMI